MGKYKRNKSKPKKKVPFIHADIISRYINEEKEYFESLPDNILKMERIEISEGMDRYYSEHGHQWDLTFYDGSKYSFGEVTITEDGDDWAQAESYTSDIMRKEIIVDGEVRYKNVSGYELITKMQNVEVDFREYRLKKLLTKS